ncbi:MAG: DUF177 domain-containing protein [Bacteroidales bacterium]|jgi:uncharacterized metal-binding protein YceD (DUF177 family)|nr:DUF177 domain-containing protein [Bacteroidales bacterium]
MMPGKYSIPVTGIKPGHHVFEYKIDKTFFDLFEESEIKEGSLDVLAELEKGSSHIDLVVKISGTVNICCDRCLAMFDHPLVCENRLLIKYGQEMDDGDPEIITLPRDEHHLDLSQYFYEFIHLALPIKRIHPYNEAGVSGCDPLMIQKLRQHLVVKEKGSDTQWEELRKLMEDN